MDCVHHVKESRSHMDFLYVWLRGPLALEPTGPIIPPSQPAQTGIKGLWVRIRRFFAKLWPKRRTR
jgi:hypothetical protein